MAHCFFVVYYEPDSSHFVDDACEQLQRAIDGKQAIVTIPDGLMAEQFDVGDRDEEWE